MAALKRSLGQSTAKGAEKPKQARGKAATRKAPARKAPEPKASAKPARKRA